MKKAAEALEWLGIKSSPKDAGLLGVPMARIQELTKEIAAIDNPKI